MSTTLPFSFLLHGDPYEEGSLTQQYPHWHCRYTLPRMWCHDVDTDELFQPMLVAVFGMTAASSLPAAWQLIRIVEARVESSHTRSRIAEVCTKAILLAFRMRFREVESVTIGHDIDVEYLRLLCQNQEELWPSSVQLACVEGLVGADDLMREVVTFVRSNFHALNRDHTVPAFYSRLSKEQLSEFLMLQIPALPAEDRAFCFDHSSGWGNSALVHAKHYVRLYTDPLDASYMLSDVNVHERSMQFHAHVPPGGEITIDLSRVALAETWFVGLHFDDIEALREAGLTNVPVGLPRVYFRRTAKPLTDHDGLYDSCGEVPAEAVRDVLLCLTLGVKEMRPVVPTKRDGVQCFWCSRVRLMMKSCSACSVAHYCTPEHQGADWKAGHRKYCKVLQKTKTEQVVVPAQVILSLGSASWEASMRGETCDDIGETERTFLHGLETTETTEWVCLSSIQRAFLSDIYTCADALRTLFPSVLLKSHLNIHFLDVSLLSHTVQLLRHLPLLLPQPLPQLRILFTGPTIPSQLHQRVMYLSENETERTGMVLAPETGILGDTWHSQGNRAIVVRMYADHYHTYHEKNTSQDPADVLFSLNSGGRHSFWSASSRLVVKSYVNKIPVVVTEPSLYDAQMTIDTITDIVAKDSGASVNLVPAAINRYASPFQHECKPLPRHRNAYRAAFRPK